MDERRKREKLVSARRRKREEGDTRARRYREPRRRFQLKCRHRRIAAVGVGVGVARVMCTTWCRHANRTPRLSASSSRPFSPTRTWSHCSLSFSSLFFFDFITTLEYCRGEGRRGLVSFHRRDSLFALPFFCVCSFYFYFLGFVLLGFNGEERKRAGV